MSIQYTVPRFELTTVWTWVSSHNHKTMAPAQHSLFLFSIIPTGFLNGRFPASFSFFFVFSIKLTVKIVQNKFCPWLVSNSGPLVSEATAQLSHNLFAHLFHIIPTVITPSIIWLKSSPINLAQIRTREFFLTNVLSLPLPIYARESHWKSHRE